MGDSALATFSYDDANRLLSLTHSEDGSPSAAFAYAYDAVGNRLSESVGAGAENLARYTYDDADRLTRVQNGLGWYRDETFEYDANGNLTRQVTGLMPSWSLAGQYHYDAANRLTQTGMEQDGAFVETAAFGYNGDGLRVSQTEDGVVTPYLWDVASAMPQLLTAGTYAYSYGHTVLDRSPMLPGGQALSYRLDGLGSVRQTVDDGLGQVLNNYSYEPFGQMLGKVGSDATRGFMGEAYACPELVEGTWPRA